MSAEFQILTQQAFTVSDIDAGSNIYVGADQINAAVNDTYKNLNLTIDYHSLLPAQGDVQLQALIEGKSPGGNYHTIAYQFRGYVGWLPQFRNINMQYNMNWDDPGVDNNVFVGNTTIGAISNQQSLLPPMWRVRIHLHNPGGNFVSANLSIFGTKSELV